MGEMPIPDSVYAQAAAHRAIDETRGLEARVEALEAEVRLLAGRLGVAPEPTWSRPLDPEPPPFVCHAESAPPIPGRVGFYVERIVPAEDVDAVAGRRRHILASHVSQMAGELSGSRKEEQIAARQYRIRISIEPEDDGPRCGDYSEDPSTPGLCYCGRPKGHACHK